MKVERAFEIGFQKTQKMSTKQRNGDVAPKSGHDTKGFQFVCGLHVEALVLEGNQLVID